MVKYVRKNFNIQRFLSLKILDTRGIAARNDNVTADKYFSDVEYFIANAPKLISAFSGLSVLEQSVKASAKKNSEELKLEDRDALDKIKLLLTDIGYSKLNDPIDNLRKAILRGDTSSAEVKAKVIAEGINALYETLAGVYSLKKAESAKQQGTEHDNDDTEPVLLRDAMEYMDYLEENRKLRVLAVDDVAVVLNTVVSSLNHKYEVYALKSGLLVEKFLATTSPELFLLDIEMGDMNGFELITLIRKYDRFKDTPIIFLTGNASADNVKKAIALGAADFITKPINKEILLEKIDRFIFRRKSY